MNELTLTELDMGFSIPKILQASAPTVDHQGRHRNGSVCQPGPLSTLMLLLSFTLMPLVSWRAFVCVSYEMLLNVTTLF